MWYANGMFDVKTFATRAEAQAYADHMNEAGEPYDVDYWTVESEDERSQRIMSSTD